MDTIRRDWCKFIQQRYTNFLKLPIVWAKNTLAKSQLKHGCNLLLGWFYMYRLSSDVLSPNTPRVTMLDTTGCDLCALMNKWTDDGFTRYCIKDSKTWLCQSLKVKCCLDMYDKFSHSKMLAWLHATSERAGVTDWKLTVLWKWYYLLGIVNIFVAVMP